MAAAPLAAEAPSLRERRSYGMYLQKLPRPLILLRDEAIAGSPKRPTSAATAPQWGPEPGPLDWPPPVVRCKSAPTAKGATGRSASQVRAANDAALCPAVEMEGRSRATLVTHAAALFLFGGCGPVNPYTGERFRNDTFRFNLETGQWARLPCRGYFPRPRIHHTAVVKGPQMVVFGGVNEDHAFLDDMYALSLRELPAVWRKVAVAADAPALPQAPALCSHSAAVHPGRNSMVVYGGRRADGGVSSEVLEFAFSTQRWTSLSQTEGQVSFEVLTGPPLYGHSVGIVEDVMYVCGGDVKWPGRAVEPNCRIYAYNLCTRTWRVVHDVAALPPPVPALPGCMVVDPGAPQAWALGPVSTAIPLETTPRGPLRWFNVLPVPHHRLPKAKAVTLGAFPAMAVAGRRVFLLGGELAGEDPTGNAQALTFHRDLYAFDFDSHVWSHHSDGALPRPEGAVEVQNVDGEEAKRPKPKALVAVMKPIRMEVAADPSRKPIWQRNHLPQKPAQPPDFDWYVGRKPAPRPPLATEPTAGEAGEPPEAPDRAVKSIAKAARLRGLPTAGRGLPVLSDALRAASAKETVKLLLAEKRQFRQELDRLLATAVATPAELSVYEGLLERVLLDHQLQVTDSAAPPPAGQETFLERQQRIMREAEREVQVAAEKKRRRDAAAKERRKAPVLPPRHARVATERSMVSGSFLATALLFDDGPQTPTNAAEAAPPPPLSPSGPSPSAGQDPDAAMPSAEPSPAAPPPVPASPKQPSSPRLQRRRTAAARFKGSATPASPKERAGTAPPPPPEDSDSPSPEDAQQATENMQGKQDSDQDIILSNASLDSTEMEALIQPSVHLAAIEQQMQLAFDRRAAEEDQDGLLPASSARDPKPVPPARPDAEQLWTELSTAAVAAVTHDPAQSDAVQEDTGHQSDEVPEQAAGALLESVTTPMDPQLPLSPSATKVKAEKKAEPPRSPVSRHPPLAVAVGEEAQVVRTDSVAQNAAAQRRKDDAFEGLQRTNTAPAGAISTQRLVTEDTATNFGPLVTKSKPTADQTDAPQEVTGEVLSIRPPESPAVQKIDSSETTTRPEDDGTPAETPGHPSGTDE